MAYLIGSLLAVAVAAMATLLRMDRDRAFYPTVLIVVASYYVLFAVMGASGKTLAMELAAASVFLLLAIFGFMKNLWVVAGATVGHGLFDLVHRRFIADPGVPPWWPGFCMAFDVIFGLWLAMRLRSGHARS